MGTPITARAAILQALIEGDAFGLEIIERVQDRTGGRVRLHQGSIYPALRSLEREGLVESYESDPVPERGGRPRRYYYLTAEGVAAADGERMAILSLLGVPVPEAAP